jgi:hypothetical protein
MKMSPWSDVNRKLPFLPQKQAEEQMRRLVPCLLCGFDRGSSQEYGRLYLSFMREE